MSAEERVDGGQPNGQGWRPAVGWVDTGRDRPEAVRTSIRKHPWLWLTGKVVPSRRRRGMSLRHEPATSANEILERVATLPLSVWTYGWEHESVRHLGPMAQDFAAAFGLGDRDDMINMVDSAGVLLAAVQALHRRVVELETQVATLQAATASPPAPEP